MKKTAVITGGASGMGLATAAKLFQEGDYNVVVADVSFGRDVPNFLDAFVCNVGSEKQVGDLFAYLKGKYGTMHLLVNFAGVHTSVKAKEATLEEFDAIYRTNVLGTFLCCRSALQLMEAGVIINIGSSVGIAADKDAPLYAASKAWVIHFTKCLALEYGKSVRCNAICPGPIDTKFLRNAMGNDEKVMQTYANMNPRGRIARPEEVADLVLFLASEKADFINGATIQIDGGESIVYAGEPPK